MATYTPDNPRARYIAEAVLSRPGLLNYVNLLEGELVGENGIFIPRASRPIASRVNCDWLPTGRGNEVTQLEAEHWAVADCFTRGEYNSFQRDIGRRRAVMNAAADSLRLEMEDAMFAPLEVATNTYPLATDNDPTVQEIIEAMAIADEGGATSGRLVMATRAEFASNLIENGAQLAGGGQSDLGNGRSYFGRFYNMDIILSTKLTVSAATGGTAAIIWDPVALLGSVVDIDWNGPARIIGKATWDYDADSYFGFALAEGAGDSRVVRVVNP